jgi:hypothetical protein
MLKPKPLKSALLAFAVKQFHNLCSIARDVFERLFGSEGIAVDTRRTLYSLRGIVVVIFITFAFTLTYLLTATPLTAQAATNATINFQARLETASGSIVPDGNYNVEFKLYNALTSSGSSQGSCTGDANCLWVETRTGTNQVGVANGYLTVDLGSVTAFPATINWDQDLYLSMNIGGTGATPSWDGEMSPRLHLTAVPYAFRAGRLAQYNGTTGFTSTLSLTQPTGGNQTFTLPDMAAAGTYSLLTSTTGVQLQASTPGTAQTGNFNISGTGIAGTLETSTLDTASTGTLSIGTTNATTIQIGNTTAAAVQTINIGNNNTSGSSTTVNIGPTTGAGNTMLQAGTGTLTIRTQAGGTINIGANNAHQTITIGNNSTTTAVNINAGTGGLNLGNSGVANSIQIGNTIGAVAQTINIGNNGTASSTTNVTIGSAIAGLVTVQSSGIQQTITASSDAIKTTTNSTTAFQVQNALAATILNVDTSNGRVVIGTGSSGAVLVLDGSTTDPTYVDGAMYYNTSSKSFRCGQNGAWVACDGPVYTEHASGGTPSGDTLSNWTSSKAFSDIYTSPANDCQPGVTYMITAAGYFDTASTAPTYTFYLYYGGDMVQTGGMSGSSWSNITSGAGWQMNAQIVCEATGSGTSGKIDVEGVTSVMNTRSGGANNGVTALTGNMTNGNTGYAGVDTTIPNSIKVQVSCNTASTSNSVTMTQFIVQRLGP